MDCYVRRSRPVRIAGAGVILAAFVFAALVMPSLASAAAIGSTRPVLLAAGYRHRRMRQANPSAWGHNYYGEIGDATNVNRLNTTAVSLPVEPVVMAAGLDSSYAVGRDGSMWQWGQYLIGAGTVSSRPSPVRLWPERTWMTVDAGDLYELAIATDGSLWAWGDNSAGQLGDGTTISRLSPVQVGTATGWKAVSAGASNALALDPMGRYRRGGKT